MTEIESKFLDVLKKLLESYSIDEVRCEEKDGAKCIVFYSNSSYLSFRLFKDGKYFDILSRIPEYDTESGCDDNGY